MVKSLCTLMKNILLNVMKSLELKRWYITYNTIHVAQVMIFLKQCAHKSIFYMFALNEGLSWYQRSVPCDTSTCFWIPSWGPMSRRRKKNLSDSFNDVTHGKTIICIIFFRLITTSSCCLAIIHLRHTICISTKRGKDVQEDILPRNGPKLV